MNINPTPHRHSPAALILTMLAAAFMVLQPFAMALADVPGESDGIGGYLARKDPSGTSVPNPGTQEQELANITFPAPYNVFEFVVTCAACHGGTIDQNAAHFGNWAGTSMASATRDPFFRAAQIAVDMKADALAGGPGGGNVCIRCHSPNAWYSGRTDPLLNGESDGSSLMHSILLSTDDEGILCESCHRVMGNVTMKSTSPGDSAWLKLSGIYDWPHTGGAYTQGPIAGLPFGDATLQLNDGMTYAGKYGGSVAISFSDDGSPYFPSAPYTGQTFAVYPAGHAQAGQPYVANDGSVPLHYENPIAPTADMALSLEHPTAMGDMVTTPEFCGSCHDFSVPILNSGMPEQRTYSEWNYSDFGNGGATETRCQDCHMPTMKHEYADGNPVSINPDPTVSGWFPYARDRNAFGGTAFHQFAGANRDLPQVMKALYPEPDLEVLGTATGNDTRVFPGMLSTRDPMYDRAHRNTELQLENAVQVAVTRGPVDLGGGIWEMDVTVTNTAGHRIPSGYPDGRRFWVSVTATDTGSGTAVYESGVYDSDRAILYNDSADMTAQIPMSRALSTTIDATGGNNAVMVYEKLTGTANGDGTYTPSPDVLNSIVLFDNRIPPAGFSYADYQAAGTKFITYNNAAEYVPSEEPGRFTDNTDTITYRFSSPSGATLEARAEVYWQTHSRVFVEYLKEQDNSTVKPEGPINAFMPGYPLAPNYLYDSIPIQYRFDLDGQPLANNWGGVAYAAWRMAGKGVPFKVASHDTAHAAAPAAAPQLVVSTVDPFTLMIDWNAVADADSYELQVRLGEADATADWFGLATVKSGEPLSVVHTALNVAKTYAYRARAKNGLGDGPFSDVALATTPTDLPLPPENLKFLSATENSISMTWQDVSDNETNFVIQRQDVPVTGDYYLLERMVAPNPGGFGGVSYTDTSVNPGKTYNYRVAAENASGLSTWTAPPLQASSLGAPTGSINLTASSGPSGVFLSWDGLTGTVVGYSVQRSSTGAGGPFGEIAAINGDVRSYLDAGVSPDTDYWYRVVLQPTSAMVSNVVAIHTLTDPPAAPGNLNALAYGPNEIRLSWIDNSSNESGFVIQRSLTGNPDPPVEINVAANMTGYIDLAVTADQSYDYLIYAVNAAGSSAASNKATAVTPPSGAAFLPPVPAFTASPLTGSVVLGSAPLAASFTNQTNTQGAATTYAWEFGDGATSTLENPSHIYATAGTYTVKLTASGPGGQNTLLKTNYVYVVPTASITGYIDPGAVANGAGRWRVDGGAWMSSGSTVWNLADGAHLVEFLDVADYLTPAPVSITLNTGDSLGVTGTYLAPGQLAIDPMIFLLLLQ